MRTFPGLWIQAEAVLDLDYQRMMAVLEQGLVDAYKMQSTYAAVRVIGGTHAAACIIQGLVSVSALTALVWVIMRTPRGDVEAPVMALAALLVSPFLLDYDLVILALPLAWLYAQARRTGFMPHEKLVMLAAFVLPLVARTLAKGAHLPLAPLVIAALFAVVVRRLLRDVAVESAPPLASQLHPALGA